MNDGTRYRKEMDDCCGKDPSPTCCRPADANQSSCCPPRDKSWNKGKTLVSAVIIMAAIGVGANSLVRGTSAQSCNAGPANPFSARLTEIPSVAAENSYQGNPQIKPEEISLTAVLDSLRTLETLAADKDVVFIVLPGEAQNPHEEVLNQVGAVAKNLWNSRQKVGVFTLKSSAPDHSELVRHFAVKTLPCVVVLGRQGSATAVAGDITEARFTAHLFWHQSPVLVVLLKAMRRAARSNGVHRWWNGSPKF
jgi:hypothetical protein